MSVESIATYLEPVRKSVSVPRGARDAFDIFTRRIERWWPLAKYSCTHERARTVAIEPRVGGLVYEERDDGERFPWGRILVWDPPNRFVMTWHPGRDPDAAQEVEVRFTAEGSATRVDLEHRNWQKLGADAAKVREAYDGGWPGVLEIFRNATEQGEQ